jgi:DNA polymerase sigma
MNSPDMTGRMMKNHELEISKKKRKEKKSSKRTKRKEEGITSKNKIPSAKPHAVQIERSSCCGRS